MVHGVDNIVQQVDVQFLTEVQQLSGWVIRQHRHFCWHRASEERSGGGKILSTSTTTAFGNSNKSTRETNKKCTHLQAEITVRALRTKALSISMT